MRLPKALMEKRNPIISCQNSNFGKYVRLTVCLFVCFRSMLNTTPADNLGDVNINGMAMNLFAIFTKELNSILWKLIHKITLAKVQTAWVFLRDKWKRHWNRKKTSGEVSRLNSDTHDDVIKWRHFPRHWPFVRGIHRSPVNSPHKGQWRGTLMFSLICAWING